MCLGAGPDGRWVCQRSAQVQLLTCGCAAALPRVCRRRPPAQVRKRRCRPPPGRAGTVRAQPGQRVPPCQQRQQARRGGRRGLGRVLPPYSSFACTLHSLYRLETAWRPAENRERPRRPAARPWRSFSTTDYQSRSINRFDASHGPDFQKTDVWGTELHGSTRCSRGPSLHKWHKRNLAHVLVR